MPPFTISAQTVVSVPAQISVRVLAAGVDAGARAAYAIDRAVAVLEELLAADSLLQVDGCTVHLVSAQTDQLQVSSDPAQISMGAAQPLSSEKPPVEPQLAIQLYETPGDSTPFARQPAQGALPSAIDQARAYLAVPASQGAAGYVEIVDSTGNVVFSETSPLGAFTLTVERENRSVTHFGWLSLLQARQQLRDWIQPGACQRVTLTDYTCRTQPRVLMTMPSVTA